MILIGLKSFPHQLDSLPLRLDTTGARTYVAGKSFFFGFIIKENFVYWLDGRRKSLGIGNSLTTV
jgi:hypothetical protein